MGNASGHSNQSAHIFPGSPADALDVNGNFAVDFQNK